ncbi:MAG TPA: hypothetical protein VEO95_07985 [Chthoniobacteraceae bacterium]|nr:hypothetical protein [Chthoniobacteraceae bacterium]
MTTTLRAHFDGKVLVPDEPVDLPRDCALEIRVEATGAEETGLARLARMVEGLPFDPDAPTDGAAQHDHYLYGLPKR